MTDTITYAVGDIHGRLDLLQALVAAIAEDSEGNETSIVFLGDYCDRGPNSRGVIDFLMRGPCRDGEKWITLRGNHEQLFLDFILRPSPDAWNYFLCNGGAKTLQSYGVESCYPDEVRHRTF